LYWSSELDLAGFSDYLWRRLRIIASEDVGLAAPEVAVQVRALSENFADQRKHNMKSKTGSRSGELFIVQAVILLVRAPKSRMVDHAVMAV
jgi:replication-associated recombination protein RarA